MKVTGAVGLGSTLAVGGTISLSGNANTFAVGSIFRNANRVFFGGDTGGYFWQNSSNSATILQLNDSGNLGLAVTPSAWQTMAGFNIGDVGSFGSKRFSVGNCETIVGNNVYYDSTGYKYIVTDPSSWIRFINNTILFNIAASGTANTLQSYTQAMTLTAAGRLILGAGDSGELLQVNGTAKITGQTTVTTSSIVPFIATSSGVTTTLVIDNTNANLWGGVFAVRVNGSDKNYFGTLGSLVGSTNYDATIWATSGNGFRVYTNGFNKQLEITTTGAATFS
jgi:hypothetical protein